MPLLRRCPPGPQSALPAGIGTISCPDISREEIVNACGIDDFHDGACTCVGWAAAAKDKCCLWAWPCVWEGADLGLHMPALLIPCCPVTSP